jgi:hypothetical protein
LKPLEIGEPEVDERTDLVLDAGLARGGQRLLVACARLRGIDALLEAVVTGDEQLADALARLVPLHKPSVTRQI